MKEGHWGGEFNGRLVTSFCPPNYCRCVRKGDLPGCIFNPDHIDSQCDHNRTGVLCGKCQKGLSVGLRLVQNIPCPSLRRRRSARTRIRRARGSRHAREREDMREREQTHARERRHAREATSPARAGLNHSRPV